MSTGTNKRKGLSVEGKCEVIKRIENGGKEADVRRESGFVNSAICKKLTKIISVFEQNGSRIKAISNACFLLFFLNFNFDAMYMLE